METISNVARNPVGGLKCCQTGFMIVRADSDGPFKVILPTLREQVAFRKLVGCVSLRIGDTSN